MEKFSHAWTTSLSANHGGNNKKSLTYPENFVMHGVNLTWELQAILNVTISTDQQPQDYLSIYLHLTASNQKEVWTNFKFSIMNNKGQKVKSLGNRQPCKFFQGQKKGFNKFLTIDSLFDRSNDIINCMNLFTINCEITVLPEHSVTGLTKTEYKEPECRLIDDFLQMFQHQKFTDVIFIVCDKEFKAHKAVLAARSPVFNAMFENEMKESKENQVNVTDIDPSVFEEMMLYIYAGKSPNLKTMADDLLAVADKYQLEKLKAMCGKALCKNLTTENAVKILVLADRHNVTQLKIQAVNFICSHAKAVMETEDFDLISTSHPQLLAEICRALANTVPPLNNEQQDPVSLNNFPCSHSRSSLTMNGDTTPPRSEDNYNGRGLGIPPLNYIHCSNSDFFNTYPLFKL